MINRLFLQKKMQQEKSAINFKLEQLAKDLEGELYNDLTMRILYATDASAYREMPLAVVVPKSGADIKKLILDSATRYSDVMVARPGSPDGEKVRFGALSSTGGVVNAYAAVKAALAASGAVQ